MLITYGLLVWCFVFVVLAGIGALADSYTFVVVVLSLSNVYNVLVFNWFFFVCCTENVVS